MDLSIGEGAWKPTAHGEFMGGVLADSDLVGGKSVLELGGGVGNHTIIMLRRGAGSIVTTEITAELLEITRDNVRRNCPDADNVEFRVAHWLAVEGAYDVVVSNPPFCKSGKQNRRYFIDILILKAHERLQPGGSIVFVQSSMADLPKTRRRLAENGFQIELLRDREYPFRSYYFEDETFMREIRDVPGGYEVRGETFYETLYVIAATLAPNTPPAGAHLPPSERTGRA